MRIGGIVKWTLLSLAAAIVVAAGWLYVQAGRVPENYRPAQLSLPQRRQAAGEFANRLLEFSNLAQLPQAFTWTVTERQINEYLASLDEISDVRHGPNSGEARRLLARAALADPAVALGDGVICLLARQTEYNKVLSADLAIRQDADGALRVRLAAVRVGRLEVPRELVNTQIEALREKLTAAAAHAAGQEQGASGLGGLRPEDVGRLVSTVLAGIDSGPIPNELKLPIGRKKVRIACVEVRPEGLTLHVEPVARASQEP
ncbi:MAG TPA: hypothetical protein PK082_00505 [Phycisphaerae bacterium]|nr:hypothetical protein [Phycisphaerae bacterium]